MRMETLSKVITSKTRREAMENTIFTKADYYNPNSTPLHAKSLEYS